MRAWQVSAVGEPEAVMAVADAVLPAPGPGALRIKVAAAAIGLPDILLCRGTYPLLPAHPFTPGQEFVGEVIAAGEGTTTPVGARVMGVAAFMLGQGSFAEHCMTFEPMVFAVPDGMENDQAAAFTIAFHTAYLALVRRARLMAGEVLLVHGGAGGTGAAAIQLGRALGARVIATASSPARAKYCLSLGAEQAIDLTRENFVRAVDRATGGDGANVVFDPVGGKVFEDSLDCLAREGRILPIGFASGRWGVVSPEVLAMRNVSIVGALGGGFERDVMLAMHAELLRLHAEGAIRVPVERVIGFEDIAAGMQAVADRTALGRVVAVFE